MHAGFLFYATLCFLGMSIKNAANELFCKKNIDGESFLGWETQVMVEKTPEVLQRFES